MISGNKVQIEVDVAKNMGIKVFLQEFLILEDDTESMVMGVQWHSSFSEQIVEILREW